jgi:hypothetical protein
VQDAPQAAHAAWDVKGTPSDVASLPSFATPGPAQPRQLGPIRQDGEYGVAVITVMRLPRLSELCGHFAGILADPCQLRCEVQFDDEQMHEPASAPDTRRKLVCVLARQQGPEAHEQDLEIQPNRPAGTVSKNETVKASCLRGLPLSRPDP